MERQYEQQARQEYERALRIGQRQLNAAKARGEVGTLLVLEEVAENSHIMAFIKRPTREISLKHVVGTYTSSRALSFSRGFMPLHPEGTEFAGKWTALCAIHMNEGLRDPIQVYEYMWQYYVVEGNKRVSVLKYFDAPSVRAEITRLIPQLEQDNPVTQTYYAFLQYEKNGLFSNIKLSSAERYRQLARTEAELLEDLPEESRPANWNMLYLRFEGAYKTGSGRPELGDAFLEYLKVYGFPLEESRQELADHIQKLMPQMVLVEQADKEPTLLMDVQEEAPPSLVSWLFGGRKTAKVLFAYEEGRTQTNWIGAHEKGRLEMQQELQQSVTSDFLDGLTPDNAYELLTEHARDMDLLLVTSSQLAPAALRFSLENPQCMTLCYSRVRQDYRLNTYYGRYYEPMFLCGAAAGLATQSGKVAYITPQVEQTRHTPDINAFALGVKSVRPDATVYLMLKDVTVDEPTSASNGIRHAVELGCDIAQTPDYPGLSMIGPPQWSFSFLLRLHGQGVPSEYLASPAWNWGRYYTEIVKSYLNNSLEVLRYIESRETSVTGFWWGLDSGVLEFKSTNFLHPTANNLLQYLRSSIQLGRFNPFHGPIRDQDGTERVPMHSAPKPYEIMNMDWIADFVEVVK